MPFNGSGVFARVHNWQTDAAAGIDIDAARTDAEDDGFASGLSNVICKDGQTIAAANLPMGGFNHTGVANGSARNHYAALGQLQDGGIIYAGAVGGTADVITITLSPAISSYIAGQAFSFIASGNNTTNVTLNVNGLGAKALTKNGATVLIAGDIVSSSIVEVEYDGTQFQLVGGAGLSTSAAIAVVYAPLASPALTGNPTAPNQAIGNSSTRLATTAFVKTIPTKTVYTSGSGTYTTPTGVLFLKVRMVGSGQGGSGNGTSPGTAGLGTNTTFGSAFLTCNSGGNNGGATGGDVNIAGGIAQAANTVAQYINGGQGGGTPFGTGGPGGINSGAGQIAQANTGGGGGGAGATNVTGAAAGGMGGGYLEKLITSPSATYAYSVGAGGAGATVGSGGSAGGAGGSGIIIIEEFYIG